MFSNHVKATAPSVAIEKYKDLEDYMKGIIERHVQLVAVAPGSAEGFRTDILNGMTDTWHIVLSQSQQEYSRA
jgi:hypothetical protein